MPKVFGLILSAIAVFAQPANASPTGDTLLPAERKPAVSQKSDGYQPTLASFAGSLVNSEAIKNIASNKTPFHVALGSSRQGRAINAFYFPGKTDKRALIIGGVHGSELSGIEMARKIIADLQKGNRLHYSVIIIPCLFPDNEVLALTPPDKKKVYNLGRYTDKNAPDPNRQMPPLGKPFESSDPKDFLGREIEQENQVLLQLIEAFKPDRIANLHAIRDTRQAGIYADPRTDSDGYALGFETDSSLAIAMAKYIYENGGNVAGNKLDSVPTALYYNDPVTVAPGEWQPRNLKGSVIPKDRGEGVSLGSWASTAVCDSTNVQRSRQPIRLITVEFPGYKRSSDYTAVSDRTYYKQLIDLYAAAIESIFLGGYFEEENIAGCDCVKKTTSDKLITDRN